MHEPSFGGTGGETVIPRGDDPPYPPAALPRDIGQGIAPATDGRSCDDGPPYPRLLGLTGLMASSGTGSCLRTGMEGTR
jgi:hypothetical protein